MSCNGFYWFSICISSYAHAPEGLCDSMLAEMETLGETSYTVTKSDSHCVPRTLMVVVYLENMDIKL